MDINGRKPNVIDSCWILKKKLQTDGSSKYKTRLVIRGFKDRNNFDLQETYAPVSGLVRSVVVIINKFDSETCLMDVKTTFLNGSISEDIYMVITDGLYSFNASNWDKVCKLNKALYGLKIIPKIWNECFKKAALKLGLQAHMSEPCLYTWRKNDRFFYLDYVCRWYDMMMSSNDSNKLNEIMTGLQKIWDDGSGRDGTFQGIKIERNRKDRVVTLTQTAYI